ncbi:MAG: hypothetical protein J0I42_02380 [Bosea sp.]|uniref:hypothetical protein n=1 Tax=Bosea sp. (in: a-proteobacteria) TaxID=1871050 RepID=UPI001AC1C385|nr:hypothetical protein [Bosea sp. (in: a-proteobacteria)]MBN9450774.1 hypothetical protein [Bosea sp. (in: a-proteobacteria)]
MIAIFTVLGLLLLGGGGYAVYDGWPYLVLERGFTQVIIGSIASSAGLVMLSLAWVLKEVKATRRALVEAMAFRPEEPVPAAVPTEPQPVMPVRPELPSFSDKAAPAALGAVAGAMATGALAHALPSSDDEKAGASAEEPPASGDRDLFGALVTRSLEDQEPVAGHEPEDAQQSFPAPVETAEPLPDMFDEALSTPPEELSAPSEKPAEMPAEIEAEAHEPVEPAPARIRLSDEDWAFRQHDGQVPVDDQASDEHVGDEQPARHDETAETLVGIHTDDELDEFSALRASLAGHLNEPEPGAGRIEPSFSPEPDPFAAAESWMDRASPRREPWLDTPPAEEQAAAEAEPLVWPPRTEAHAFDAPGEPVNDAAEAAAMAGAAEPPHQGERPDAGSPEAEPVAVQAEPAEPPAEDAPAVPEARAASDEGIVGAYQVGDAHFTIFADGSIRARTPDGEYSFASMDELKVYLASEKSRLGV